MSMDYGDILRRFANKVRWANEVFWGAVLAAGAVNQA